MTWIYSILIWICMFIVLSTTGNIRILFFGVEIGILIGQIIYFIKEVKN